MKRSYYLIRHGEFCYYRLNSESGPVSGENLNLPKNIGYCGG
jgi:hypothetical protein